MTGIVWSPQSLRELEAHRDFIAQDSPHYADLTVRRIVAAVERLQQFPLSGRVVPERRSPSLREVIVGRFRVVYRVSPGTVEIATVFRGEQPFPAVE
ncbi:MAG: type II toxin-antitoxin system RelE/ParE family toxin [Acidobacteria bacterium]|nr:type II toxin-antitoxin system RelE/ParE family toxin [Acidobacteriota bacterium]